MDKYVTKLELKVGSCDNPFPIKTKVLIYWPFLVIVIMFLIAVIVKVY